MEELVKDLREVFEKHGFDILLNSEMLSIKDEDNFDVIKDNIYVGKPRRIAKRNIIFRCSTLIPSTQRNMADEEILYPRY